MTTPSIGAIRWDAWYSTAPGAPALATAISLGESDLQPYAPLHMQVDTGYKLTPRVSQAIIDAEITAAAANGVGYWAYLMYGRTVGGPNYAAGMMDAWDYHQSSSIKGAMPWVAMMQPGLMGATGNYGTQVATMVGYFQQSNYYTVAGGRPLLYIYWDATSFASAWGSSLANMAAMISSLRSATVAAGLATPYIVVMNGAETTVYTGLGADAITSYVGSWSATVDGTYAALDAATQAYWATLGATNVPIVPIAMSGWAPIGRTRRPVPWQASFRRPYFGLRTAWARPTAAELKAHIAAARAYVTANPSKCPANSILLYSWNEHDEGVGIAPSIGTPAGLALV